MIKRGLFAVILLLSVSQGCLLQTVGHKIKLDKNLGMPVTPVVSGGRVMPSVALEIGIKDSDLKRGLHQEMVIDFGFHEIFVPNGKDGSFGIDCTTQDSCVPTGADLLCHYQDSVDKTVPCKQASSLVRFSNSTLKDKSVNPFGFYYFKGDDAFSKRYSKRGVLGLSPISSFWSGLLNAYEFSSNQDYIDVSLYLNIDRKDRTYNLDQVDYSTSHLTVNGRFTTTPEVIADYSSPVKEVWTLPESTISMMGKPGYNARLCVDNSTHNAFFFVADFDETIKNVSKQLCGKETGCKKGNSDVSKITPFTFDFKSDSDFKVEVKGGDLVGWDSSDNAVFGIRDLKDSPSCAAYPGAKIAAGLLFFTKVEFTIRVRQSDKGPTFQIALSKNNSPTYWIILILSLVLVGMVLFIVGGSLIMRGLLIKYGVVSKDSYSDSDPRTEKLTQNS